VKGTFIPTAGSARYRVNMDLAPKSWDCEPYQLIVHRNPSWLNSAWLGTATNVLNIPTRISNEVIFNVMSGHVGFALVALVLLVVSVVAFFLAGLFGRVHCLPLAFEVIAAARPSTASEIAADRVAGELTLVKSDWRAP